MKHVRVLTSLVSVFLMITAPASTLLSQSAQGLMNVEKDGAPAGGVDVFALINSGKQPIGTTGSNGTLPFDPALLSAKVKVNVAVRECPDKTEVYVVSIQAGDACESVEANSDEPDCSCELAGAILWGSSIAVDVGQLTASGASSLLSTPVLIGGGAAALGVGLAVGLSGDGDTSSTSSTGISMVPSMPVMTTPPPTTTTVPAAPPMMPTMIDFSGPYGFNVTRINDPGGHMTYVTMPPAIDVFVASGGAFRATGGADFIRVNGNMDRNTGDFNANGQGVVNGFNVQVTFDGRIDPMDPYRITGRYAVGVNDGFPGGGAVEFFIDDVKQ